MARSTLDYLSVKELLSQIDCVQTLTSLCRGGIASGKLNSVLFDALINRVDNKHIYFTGCYELI
jgi:hypothetical protein